MSSRLKIDVRYLSLGRRHLVSAYEVKAGVGVVAGKTVRSMPERLAFTTTEMSAKYSYRYFFRKIAVSRYCKTADIISGKKAITEVKT